LGVIGATLLASAAPAREKTPAERGREVLTGPSLNPAVWSFKAYDNLWKQWGLKEKPANYEQAIRDRYGLHVAPFDNGGLPMGLVKASSFFKSGLVNNCLLCHASTIAGQTVMGLGNPSIDLQTLFEELTEADGFHLNLPYQFSYVRGTIDPINPVTHLMQFRDADLNVQKPIALDIGRNVCSDPPAWWLIKKKKTRDYTGGIDAHSTRVDMVNLLTPLNSARYVKEQEPHFADIKAFLLTVQAPRYPFAIDASLAARGQVVFGETCAKCHGTYGPEASYPNKVVPLGVIGTDRTLATGMTPRMLEHFNRSWLAQEIGPEGKPLQLVDTRGYQSPPLDGVWATAPYLHNASVPTVYALLKSSARPKIFTRSYRTGTEDYDPVHLGWKVTVLDSGPDPKLPAVERRKVYDTTQPGRANEGHVFGDKLSETERLAVIEYLKTL
jgi:hypothetical protein